MPMPMPMSAYFASFYFIILGDHVTVMVVNLILTTALGSAWRYRHTRRLLGMAHFGVGHIFLATSLLGLLQRMRTGR